MSPNGIAISKQAFFLLPKLAEIDAAITPALQRRVKEAHPELAFVRANGGRPMPPKKSLNGSRARKTILERLGLLPRSSERSAVILPRGVARDDLYDAAILCDVARRSAPGTAVFRGGERDPRGLRMEIVS